MMSRLMPAVFVLCAAAGASAQKIAILPSDHTNREGVSGRGDLPVSGGIQRTQMLYESWDLKIPNGARITKVGVRQDGGSRSAARGFKLQLEMFIGPSDRGVHNTSRSFSQNYAGTPTNVISKRIYDLPNMKAATSQPSTQLILFPLDTPVPYDASKNLAVEWRVHTNANGNRAFNYPIDVASFLSTAGRYGSACATSGRTFPTLNALPTPTGGIWALSLRGGPSLSQSVLMLSATKKNIDLRSAGMPGCFLHLDPVFVSPPVRTGSNGALDFRFRVPDNPFLHRKTFFAQTAHVDIFANSTGVVSSNGAQTTFGVRPAMSLISAKGSATASTGRVSRAGIVGVFEYN